MYCTHCGQPLSPDCAGVCQNCGSPVQNTYQTANMPPYYGQPMMSYIPPVSYENADTLLKVACFFIPLLGIILYCVDKDKKPVSAKQCLKMSLTAMGISIGSVVLIWLMMFLFVTFGVIASALAI